MLLDGGNGRRALMQVAYDSARRNWAISKLQNLDLCKVLQIKSLPLVGCACVGGSTGCELPGGTR